MMIINKIKKLLEKKYISIDKVNDVIRKAVEKEQHRLKKIHDTEIGTLIDDMYTDKSIAIEEIKADMQKVIEENKKLQKRNEYLESMYYDNAEVAKKNSIISQEISTDAMRLENEIARLTGLMHGINTRAQLYFKKCEKDKLRMVDKLRKL